MRIFADYHHGGLYHALHILFCERMGFELYRPIGFEWAERGYWKYSENPPTIAQYLDPKNCELRPDGYYYWRDTAEEIDRLGRKLAKVEADLERTLAKLASEGFVTRAPADVVEKERAKERELQEKRAKLNEQIAALR